MRTLNDEKRLVATEQPPRFPSGDGLFYWLTAAFLVAVVVFFADCEIAVSQRQMARARYTMDFALVSRVVTLAEREADDTGGRSLSFVRNPAGNTREHSPCLFLEQTLQ